MASQFCKGGLSVLRTDQLNGNQPCSIARLEAFYVNARSRLNVLTTKRTPHLSTRNYDVFASVHDGNCTVWVHYRQISGAEVTCAEGLLCCFWIPEVLCKIKIALISSLPLCSAHLLHYDVPPCDDLPDRLAIFGHIDE